MAKSRKKRAARPRHEPGGPVDATPERLAKGDDFDFVNPALIDPRQPIGRARRFRVSALDRMYGRNKIDWVQWYAGDCYRTAWHRAGVAINVVASYGERTSSTDLAYGLPRTMTQLRARRFVRDCRDQIPPEMRQSIDQLLIDDISPAFSGRRAERHVADVRLALDAMARWMRLQVAA
jgi:hypothetical protein